MNEPTTVVDIWAPGCRPCRTMEPMVDEAASRHTGRVTLEKVNADQQQARVQELKVRAVPTLIAPRGGREIARLTGAQSEQAISNLLALVAGVSTVGLKRLLRTDRTVRLIAAIAVLAVGLLSGSSLPLLLAGAATGATALPRLRMLPSK